MASDVFGLSHLIFASPKARFRSALRDEKAFAGEDTTTVDDADIKRTMSRNGVDGPTTMTVFKPSAPNWPAFELIETKGTVRIPICARGVLAPAGSFVNTAPVPDKEAEAASKLAAVFAGDETMRQLSELGCGTGESALLAKHECPLGMWFHTPDLAATVTFLTDVLEAREVEAFDGGAGFVVNVANLRRSNFLLIALGNPSQSMTHYYDDPGLAATGWIAKNLENIRKKIERVERFKVTENCALATKQSKMRVFFAHDDHAPAFEFIKLER